jgi:hypothetical protein
VRRHERGDREQRKLDPGDAAPKGFETALDRIVSLLK